VSGSYCDFCGHRCFVLRRIPDNAPYRAGRTYHMATCPRGKAFDREQTGYDADTAINPMVEVG
jgi:hypothetical protein